MVMALLALVPWSLFALIGVLYVVFYHHYAYGVIAGVVACVFFGMFFIVTYLKSGPLASLWYLAIGLLVLLAVAVGTCCGNYNYWDHLFQYWSVEEMRTYSNVMPTEPAASHPDAGVLIFSKDARVDTTRAVGHKLGTSYCVAPILDEQNLDHVEYWAAGIDCCGSRADFSCDDAWDPDAKSGVVILDTVAQPGGKAPEGTFRFWGKERDMYLRAIKDAEATFLLTSADNPIFVRWTASPHAMQAELWRGAMGMLGASILIYLITSIILAVAVHTKFLQNEQSPQLGKKGGKPAPASAAGGQ